MTESFQRRLENAIGATGFGEAAVRYARRPGFLAAEVDYKRRLAASLRAAVEGMRRGDERWLETLRNAVQSRDDNILDWRLRAKFLEWCQADPVVAGVAVRRLLDEPQPAPERLEAFARVLAGGGLTRPGEQLVLGSVLLMAAGADDHPPVRARVLRVAGAKLGLLSSDEPVQPAERYARFIAILDALIAFSAGTSRPLASRLEAQGAVYCIVEEWAPGMSIPSEPEFVGDVEETADADIGAAAHDLAELDETERVAVVAARRGQGRYRRELLNLWMRCAVTGCTSESMLRASHLKPWRDSSNADRLNRYNGLLLTPNLDHALDRYLITFTERGRILLSSSFQADDAAALGLDPDMTLEFVLPAHQPFLSHHRAQFERREAALTAMPRTLRSVGDDDD
ncbi:MAG: HNH endonuclease [Gemmatimonadetes bacterium]|nr:HNH endonuclease [Gemmatimonadota bacterium]